MSLPKTLSTAAAGAAFLALSACTSMPVTTDVNPNASVGACHSYAWAHEHYAGGPQGAFANPVNADRLRVAIQSNLAAHGMRRASDPKSADCVIGYAIGSRVVADDFAGWGWGMGYGWGGGWGPRGPGPWGWGGYGPAPVRNDGRISIDLFDANTHRAIWHASVDQNVTDLTGQAAETRIDAAVAAIFQKFPAPVVPPRTTQTTTIRPVT
ncbi:MAG TPA: DUF4136 domain-containing protein [Steroidobacteraceae bacterium]|nr:DUF4136 domain-containing protein [Steroidobacteraceae bacterium]